MSGSNRLSGLKARPKPAASVELPRIDHVAEAKGFVDRSPRKKPGRKKSPRTYQLHPKVLPQIGAALTAEAERLGLTQGQLIEQIWDMYQNNDDPNP